MRAAQPLLQRRRPLRNLHRERKRGEVEQTRLREAFEQKLRALRSQLRRAAQLHRVGVGRVEGDSRGVRELRAELGGNLRIGGEGVALRGLRRAEGGYVLAIVLAEVLFELAHAPVGVEGALLARVRVELRELLQRGVVRVAGKRGEKQDAMQHDRRQQRSLQDLLLVLYALYCFSGGTDGGGGGERVVGDEVAIGVGVVVTVGEVETEFFDAIHLRFGGHNPVVVEHHARIA